MASPSIEQIVAQIRTAIFGKDVRENIALGIEKCYEDSENNAKKTDVVNNVTTTESGKILDARQGKVLKDRTEEINTEINNKINDINSAISDNVIDILSYLHKDTFPYTSYGITVTHPKEHTFHFEGTISSASSSFVSLYADVNTLPSYLVPGNTYYMKIKGAQESQRIYFEVLGFRNGSTQISFTNMVRSDGTYKFTIPSNWVGGVYIRAGWLSSDAGTVVNETVEWYLYSAPISGDEAAEIAYTLNTIGVKYFDNTNVYYTSCDDVPAEKIVFVSSTGGVLNIPDFPCNSPGLLLSLGDYNIPIQIAIKWDDSGKTIYIRSKNTNNTWKAWNQISGNGFVDFKWLNSGITPIYSNLNNLPDDGIWFVSSSGGIVGIDNYPYTQPGMVLNFVASNTIKWQIVYPFDPSGANAKYRVNKAGTWSNWYDIGGNSQTITITQEVSRDTYNNEYNISVSPSITVDSNGWLQPVDANTSDETGKTDMTSAIMAMLNQTGYCHLAPGIYYVSGNIDMPADSMIEGCGKQTIIRLLQSQSSGYIIRMHTRSTLKNVCLSGKYDEYSISDGNIGGRKGIQYIGNRDGQSSGVMPSTCTLCQIEGCWFENLDSGFYGYNAGGGLQEGVEMSNCFFTRCKAGINIDYWTEYCKFTNCVTFQCYYACINNGGNNVFTACTFHGVVGLALSKFGNVFGALFSQEFRKEHGHDLGAGHQDEEDKGRPPAINVRIPRSTDVKEDVVDVIG